MLTTCGRFQLCQKLFYFNRFFSNTIISHVTLLLLISERVFYIDHNNSTAMLSCSLDTDSPKNRQVFHIPPFCTR